VETRKEVSILFHSFPSIAPLLHKHSFVYMQQQQKNTFPKKLMEYIFPMEIQCS